ncbi:transposase [Paenibacillus allorhizosphaerae]|uniref:transposase n=1 Tax=Paenibacillus allorhizosphaerae TaxID=2849866 RepID=UPI001E2F47DA
MGSRFPSAAHLCLWAGLVPGQNESTGKRKTAKTRKGNKYLRAALIEVAHSVCRSDNYLGAQYRRIAARKGRHRASVAVAHSIMAIVYDVLTRKEGYKDLGSHYFEQRQQEALMKQAARRLESLGFQVTLSSAVS